ncbi:MAG: FAD-dependent oxidoreductase [Planctomycetota bacterium]|nr:FAD-dependent oxidoreductase [Planctomycetota bacterium]
MPESKIHDVIIIGAGPAGFAAALYATRDRYDTLILDKSGLPGGQILLTERIENYPGYELVSGPDLIAQMTKQVENFGASVTTGAEATSLRRKDDGVIEVQVNGGEKTCLGRAVILCPGSDYRSLGVPGEAEMRQATRVSYCATCDGAFYRDKHVLTVGGGNTAVEDAIYLAERFTKKITLIHRRTEFRAQKILVEELYDKADKHNIEIKLPYVLEEIIPNSAGDDIDHVVIKNVNTGGVEEMKVDGVFIFAGMVPNTKWLAGAVELDDAGYIRCNCQTFQTSLPGVFAAGDCRAGAAMQLVTACADGVVAAMMLKQYFRDPAAWTSESAEGIGGAGW